MFLKIIAAPLLLYRVFFKKWADKQEQMFQVEIGKRSGNGESVYFQPELPNKRAAIRNALVYLGYSIQKGWKTEEINFAWHDETVKQLSNSSHRAFNINCTDISKSFLDEIHAEVFGYGLTVNPKTANGKILEKSELNGKHDAQIINTPCDARDGYVYQKIIDNRKGLLYKDIRPVVIGSEIPITYLNYRLAGKRFSAKKIKAKLAKTDDLLSIEEQSKILEICTKMGVDLAELDVLRDRNDGKIYVVDVNPTAYGPAHGLSFKEKMDAVEIYSRSLKKLIDANYG